MHSVIKLLLILSLSAQCYAKLIKLASFDGAKDTTYTWKDMNDPVMGGVSKATFTLDKPSGTALFKGLTAIVPSLKAPGFCNAETTDGYLTRFANVQGASHMSLKVKHTGPVFKGYKISFAANTLDPQFDSYKAPFEIKSPGVWEIVHVPFTDFSKDWSSYTGRCDTIDPTGKAHKCCNSTYPEVCPTEKNKGSIQQLGLWTEGVEGSFSLSVEWIGASNGTAADLTHETLETETKKDYPSSCSGPIQANLKYNVSDRFNALPFPTAPDESLAAAVCCDPDFKPYAEPQHFFEQPDVALFGSLNQKGLNVFYDSVCGIPLFEAPKGRSFDDFHKDTIEHGWPSFRSEEVIGKNVLINNETGEVTSSCGTHLGSYLPDEKGPRWCMDLSCLSGNAPSPTPPPPPPRRCFHMEDTEDHKCFEACSTQGKFATKGIDQQGSCPSQYNTIDTTKTVLQCPDGVTNVRYCAATALDVTIATKGEAGEVTMLGSESGGNDVTLYKVKGDGCGQATLDKKYESYAVKFAGLKEGTCASVGYSVPDGSKTIKVPVLGDIKIAEFKK